MISVCFFRAVYVWLVCVCVIFTVTSKRTCPIVILQSTFSYTTFSSAGKIGFVSVSVLLFFFHSFLRISSIVAVVCCSRCRLCTLCWCMHGALTALQVRQQNNRDEIHKHHGERSEDYYHDHRRID